LFVYFPQFSFFRDEVETHGIPIRECTKSSGFCLEPIRRIVGLIRERRFEVIVSFLSNPNIYAELSRVFRPSVRLIVSERSSHLGEKSAIDSFVARSLHCLASQVVTNSFAHAEWLKKKFPWLKPKVTTIYNGLDVALYAGAPNPPEKPSDLSLIALGRIGVEKNVTGLIKGLDIFRQIHGWVPSIGWVGRQDSTNAANRTYWKTVNDLLNSLPEIKRRWNWLGERHDVPDLLKEYHALIHPSFYEGLPNAVCEALAAGRPVLASDVCDNPLLVRNGEHGFLFSPEDPGAIARAIDRLTALKTEEWTRMSAAALDYAETSLSIDRLVTGYESLFNRMANS